jgi:2-amino-4-hydroxy-6-hydroxymethyldihydropteridine diphosphokinase
MNKKNVQAFIALGANLAPALENLKSAIKDIKLLPFTKLIKVSPLYCSAPFEAVGPDFLNAVIYLMTELNPNELLEKLQKIETKHHRTRTKMQNAPRTLDLDLLIYADLEQSNNSFLILPHPRLHERAFVLFPLMDIAPDLLIPGKGLVKNLFLNVKNQKIKKINDYWCN